MKLAKPQWNLLTFILPPIFSSVMLIIFFPHPLFQFLMVIAISSMVLTGWVLIKNSSIPIGLHNTQLYNPKPNKARKTVDESQNNPKEMSMFRWLFSLYGLIFLLGVSSVFFVFLTAAGQLPPEKLSFGELAKTWQIAFSIGIGILIAQIIMTVLSSARPPLQVRSAWQSSKIKINAEIKEKMQASSRIFLQLTSFGVLAISLSVVILTVANGLARWLGFSIPTGFQLQTMIGSSLICFPFLTKKWRKRRFLKSKWSKSYQVFILAIGLIAAIILLSIFTSPFAGIPISVQFLSYGLTTTQWELFVLAWWIGITPLMARQIIQLSSKKSLGHVVFVLIISSIFVYNVCAKFLFHGGGEEYFLAVVREGILALILTALPIGGLILMVLPFQRAIVLKHKDHYLTHSLMQGTAFATTLYWVTGLSILLVLLLMVAVPRLMVFLLIETKESIVEEVGRKKTALQQCP